MLRFCVGLLALLAALGTVACKTSYRSTSEITVSSQDIVYLRDERTSLCFAVLALQNPAGTSIREMTMTSVPCEKLDRVSTR